jgi:hypothetical protein
MGNHAVDHRKYPSSGEKCARTIAIRPRHA